MQASPLIIISGLSGSGKTVALHALEDLGYYCVDNLPGNLLPALASEVRSQPDRYPRVAIGIDARSGPEGLERLPELLASLSGDRPFRLLFLDTDSRVLIRRFSETRRRHPLADLGGVEAAIEAERGLLAPIRERADWIIDTSENNIHQLRRQVWRAIGVTDNESVQSLVLESFAYKRGVPRDVDMVFDARCLPNPHWQPGLRAHTGLEVPVREYLEAQPIVDDFCNDVLTFVRRWLPALAEDQRSLVTVAIGCTGGQHRSVYIVDRIAHELREEGVRVLVSHRELGQ
ncbi:RNase adapter RapZ [Wenzhouxiangella sp. XN201]|uniref:RNase adapter RapZ n=1 Tax=Wenzhouxiangella sp. XN201 TaxID=2710755 RepID=UPI0013C988AD|nr:RNase adapter RapZ [Wenzhouxiangella sp. XN201]NEZ04664.1 RNase adapter RapZ [Wenzhouxiangella sp. XN201]